MGLDIYLYNLPEREAMLQKEQIFESERKKIWDTYGGEDVLTPEQRDPVRKKITEYANTLGLDEYGQSQKRGQIEIPSTKYPNHGFKIGYFRSSYNESGIERILNTYDIHGLHAIFDYDGAYEFSPDWDRALEWAKRSLAELIDKKPYRCKEVRLYRGSKITCEKDALELFMKETEANRAFKGGYTNGDGEFYPDSPLEVYALIPGTAKGFFGPTNDHTMNVIYKGDNEYYIQALEIVVETIEWVLAQDKPSDYYFHWSS